MPYTAEISPTQPGCFLFLVIQCIGMSIDMPGLPGVTKGEVAAHAVNEIVNELLIRCYSDQGIQDCLDVGILGFTTPEGRKVGLRNTYTLPGTTPERPFLPISQVEKSATAIYRAGESPRNNAASNIMDIITHATDANETDEIRGIWLQHDDDGSWDPMSEMLWAMGEPLADWIERHPASHPPIVIIICDGWSSDGDPREYADWIKEHGTADGNVLLFAVHLSSGVDSPIVFPSREYGLPSMGEAADDAIMMFRMTSELPTSMRRRAAQSGFAVDENSRGLILNADAAVLAQFMDIASIRDSIVVDSVVPASSRAPADSYVEERAKPVVNREPRCPCLLLVDVSVGMGASGIGSINQAIRNFRDALASDPLTSRRAEIAVVSFAGEAVIEQDFITAGEFEPPSLGIRGGASIAKALNKGLDLIRERKRAYQSDGIDHFRPLVLLITAGKPGADTAAELAQVQARIKSEEAERNVAIFAFGVAGEDLATLSGIMASQRPPQPLRQEQFGGIFRWLAGAVSAISASQPGERLRLPNPADYVNS